MGEHPQQSWTSLRDEGFHAGGACGLDGGDDPAARGEDIEIRHAAHLHRELIGAVARPDEMRVRVHKARHEHTTAGIKSGFVGIGILQFVCSADRDDLFIANHHRAFFDNAKSAEVMSALGTARKSKKLGSRMNEHVYHRD